MPMMIVLEKLSYSPGSVVSGHVVVIKKSPEKVKGLTMRFIGRSSKLITETDAIKNYKKEVYFDEKFDLFGHDGSNTLLKIGETLFPFTFNLPPGLPSSFIWPSGNILYFMEAKLTRSSWKDDKRVSSRVTVEGIFDLNIDHLSSIPAEIKRHRYVQHLLSKSGPTGFNFKISRSGFVRGHTVPFSVEIKNLSKIDAKKLRISLLQEVNQDGKVSTSLVEQLKGPAIHSGEIQSWEARLKVPPDIPPTNLGNILNYPGVLSLQYFIHIQLSLKSATVEPLCAKIPVTIGTIPMLRSRDRHRLQQLQQMQGNIPIQHHHDHDCPLSQLILPINSSSPSQFNPHLVTPSSGAITVHSSVVVTQNGSRSVTPSHLLLGSPLHRPGGYDFYLGPNDENARFMRPISSCSRRHMRPHREIRESPPPSYDEVFSTQDTQVMLSNRKVNLNQSATSTERYPLPAYEYPEVIEPIDNSSITISGNGDQEVPTLPMPNNNNNSNSQSCSHQLRQEEPNDHTSLSSLIIQ